VIFTLLPPLGREKTPVPIEQEAVHATNQVVTFWCREVFLAFTGIRTPDCPAIRTAAKPLTLRLSLQIVLVDRSLWYIVIFHNTLSLPGIDP
jgi:hypothetical protein